MRRGMFLLAVVATVLALASGVAVAQVITCPTGANGLCVGTNRNDTLNGTPQADDMRGLKGQDTLEAGADFDQLAGGRGNDIMNGGADNDGLTGGPGDDTMNGGGAEDAYNFANGWGHDRIADNEPGMFGERLSFSLVTQPIKMDLISSPSRPEVQSGANTLNFGPNIEVNEIDASSSDDDIKGDDGPDFLNGIQGNDTIRGRKGPDTVVGMDGKDELFGGSGEDSFEGGKGPDVLRAVDGEQDELLCGPGQDTAFFDQGLDNLQGCEKKRGQ